MDFSDAGGVDDGPGVGEVQAASWHDDDSLLGQCLQLGDEGCALGAGGLLSGGEESIDFEGDEILERLKGIAAHVESAMEGDGKGASLLDQTIEEWKVDVAQFSEAAQDDAVAAEVPGNYDIAEHDFNFGGGIQEITGARADEQMDWNFQLTAGEFDASGARCDAALGKIGAEFDPVSSTELSGAGAFEGVGADFDADHEGQIR